MANPTTTLSGSIAAGTCTLLQGKPTTGFATYLPSKRDASADPSHHPLFVPLPESSSRSPSTSLPILLPVIHTPSGHPVVHAGRPVTYALPRSTSGKPPQSPLVSPHYVATMKSYPLATHSLVPALVNTAARPLIPNSHVSKSHNSSHARDVLPSNAPYKPFMPSQIAPTYETVTSISSYISENHQTMFSTITSTLSETPQSTFPTPTSITNTTDDQPTVSIPSSITGLTTLADGAVASATNAVANPVQGASLSSAGHVFFGNHPVVIFVFLSSGIVIASVVALALYCCRRRREPTQRHRGKLEEISAPLPQKPFTMREDTKSHGGSSNQIAPLQSFINVPFNRSGDSLPAARSDVDTLLPPPVMQRERRKSSYRVPVRYSGLDAQGNNPRTTDRKYTGPFSNYLPAQATQILPSPNVPPPLPTRSPLRMLADNNILLPQVNPKRLSRASSPSLYPPSDSLSTSSAAMAPESLSVMEQGIKKAGNLTQVPGLSSVGPDGAYSFRRTRNSPVENPTSDIGPPLTARVDEVCRTVPLPRYSVR